MDHGWRIAENSWVSGSENLKKNCQTAPTSPHCQGSVVCHLFLPLVSIFGLFPVLVSCHWVNLCPAVCMWLCVNYPVYLVPVFWVWFHLVYSLLPVFPVCQLCLVLPCLALMSLLNIIIWVYVLVCVSLFLPAVCTVTHMLFGRVSRKILLIQKQTPAYSVIRHDWNFKWHWLLWSDVTKKIAF